MCPVTDNEFSHCQSSLQIHSAIASWIHGYFDNVITKFIIRKNRRDAWKTDVNMLNDSLPRIPTQATSVGG